MQDINQLKLERAKKIVSDAANSIKQSTIRDLLDIFRSNPSAYINASIGQSDIAPPLSREEAAIVVTNTIFKGKLEKYGVVAGEEEFTKALAEYLNDFYDNREFSPKGIMPIFGSSQAFFMVALGLTNEGDKVLFPAPYYANQEPIFPILGRETIKAESTAEQGWMASLESIKTTLSENKDTKLLVLTIPGNPSGGSLTEEEAKIFGKELNKLLKEYPDLKIFIDHAYLGMEKPDEANKQHSFISYLEEDVAARVVTAVTFSKTHALPNIRLGALFGDEYVIAKFHGLQNKGPNNVGPMSQIIAAASLEKLRTTSEIQQILANEYSTRIDFFEEALKMVYEEVGFNPNFEKDAQGGGMFSIYKMPFLDDNVPTNLVDEVGKPTLETSLDSVKLLMAAHKIEDDRIDLKGLVTVPLNIENGIDDEKHNNFARFAATTNIENIANAIETIWYMSEYQKAASINSDNPRVADEIIEKIKTWKEKAIASDRDRVAAFRESIKTEENFVVQEFMQRMTDNMGYTDGRKSVYEPEQTMAQRDVRRGNSRLTNLLTSGIKDNRISNEGDLIENLHDRIDKLPLAERGFVTRMIGKIGQIPNEVYLANRENLQFFAKELAGQIVEGKINATISERLEIPENNIDQELDHRVTKDNKKGLQ